MPVAAMNRSSPAVGTGRCWPCAWRSPRARHLLPLHRPKRRPPRHRSPRHRRQPPPTQRPVIPLGTLMPPTQMVACARLMAGAWMAWRMRASCRPAARMNWPIRKGACRRLPVRSSPDLMRRRRMRSWPPRRPGAAIPIAIASLRPMPVWMTCRRHRSAACSVWPTAPTHCWRRAARPIPPTPRQRFDRNSSAVCSRPVA
ncbi:hypothetical protein D3C71_1293420 [compost metagenome]